MTARALAWRTMTAEPARAALAVAGVAVIGALLFDMLLLSSGLLASFRDLLDSAGYDVRVSATDSGLFTVPMRRATELADAIAGLPEVREVAIVRREQAELAGAEPGPGDVTLLNVSPGAERQTWRLVSGEDLADRSDGQAPPIVVNRQLAAKLSLSPGATLLLRAGRQGPSALPAAAFRVSGVAVFPFESSTSLVAVTTRAGFDRASGGSSGDDADLVIVAARAEFGPDAAAAAIQRLRPDVRAFSNAQLVSRIGDNGFAYFRQISVVLSSITLAFAFLLIATLLTVSVNQKLGQVAALRALGLPRRRIAAMLVWESALLVGVGAVSSLPLGWALAMILDRILREMPGIPERVHFFVFAPRTAALHLALLAAAGLAAAVYPVWIATRLPIAATLRLETVS
ncbi:MAG: FtsX-like permease family protein [Acidobacteriota bacterium]